MFCRKILDTCAYQFSGSWYNSVVHWQAERQLQGNCTKQLEAARHQTYAVRLGYQKNNRFEIPLKVIRKTTDLPLNQIQKNDLILNFNFPTTKCIRADQICHGKSS